MGSTNFFISVRNVKKLKNGSQEFGAEPGATRYLEIPDGELPHPENHKLTKTNWLKSVVGRAEVGRYEKEHPRAGFAYGDVLIFVHGYNTSMAEAMKRHDLLQKRLGEQGYKGAIVSFDWPSATQTLNYLEDRSDAKSTASKLVKDGIMLLAKAQRDEVANKCDIDVHLLGHSTGAYVIREAFYESGHNRFISRINWQVSQVAFIGADIAKKSLSQNDAKSQCLFKHSIRITNYQNPYDSALKMSNIKRLGTAPRVGRVGIPSDAPENIVNVDVGPHWSGLNKDDSNASGTWSHSWHFDDPLFAKDLYLTLKGDIDRCSIPTRIEVEGKLVLKKS
ncbi:alpha/beta hydrolase [Endozoicomonas atrinae]|uniref:alpha/beta hydrolase n=1 Tax=Endozoicomonas atrinae TaxID=1333660 RepID=UPI000825B202|nr:alpha/beta hydrolase [Endozoicomonas atrinae]